MSLELRGNHYHDLLIEKDGIKRDLLSILNLDSHLENLIYEDRYINVIIADFTSYLIRPNLFL